MFAENDLHRKSCCFKQYLNDILNEILSAKETEGIVFIPASPVSERKYEILKMSPEKMPNQKCRVSYRCFPIHPEKQREQRLVG